MSTQVASLYGVLDLQDNMTGALDKARGAMGGLADFSRGAFKTSLMIGAAGGVALAGGIGLAITEAMDGQLKVKKLESVIKSTGGVAGVTSQSAQSLADSLAQVTRFSDDAIIEGETMLLTFTNIGEDVFPRATEATLDMAEMFGTDASQAAIQLGKALQDPIEGVTALRRVGVALSAEQEQQIKSFMAVGDIASAQGVILSELEKEFGGLAQAAGDTLAGKITILKNRLLEVAETVGMALIPYLEDLAGWVGDKVVPKIEEFGRIFVEKLGEVKEALAPLVADIIAFVDEHSEAFKNAAIAIGVVLGGAAVIGAIMAVAGAIMAINWPIILIIGAVALLAWAWTEDWGGIRTFITDNVWPVIKPIFDAMVTLFTETIPNAISTLKEAFEAGGLEAVGQTILDGLESGLGDLWEWIKFALVYPLVEALIFADWSAIGQSALSLLEGIATGLLAIGEWALEHIVTPLINALLEADWAAILQTGLNILIKIAEGLGDVAVWAYDKIIQPILDKLTGGAGDVLAKAVELGKNIFNGIIEALAGLPGAILDMITGAIPTSINMPSINLNPFGGGESGGSGGLSSPTGTGGTGTPGGHFAAGGFAAAGVPITVGERGSETFVPGTSGMIIPHGGFGGGGGQTIILMLPDGSVLYEAVLTEGQRRGQVMAVMT